MEDSWEVKTGISKIFLGVTETVHLVDVFILPKHRPRIFKGEDGRPRSPFVIEDGDVMYESKDKANRIDSAIR